jgi:hypothetical protein
MSGINHDKFFLEMGIQDLKRCIERDSRDPNINAQRLVARFRTELRNREQKLQLLIEEESRS